MHEYSVTASLLDLAVKHAQAAKAQRITDLYLVIGQLSSIIDDSVQFYWNIVSENTIAAGSLLHFRRIPAEALCLKCEKRYPLNERDFACPNCGSEQIKVVAGEEFYLESIDVESEEIIEGTEE
jgi:hydrogenase nickel incorporation protein HypA/HybF